MRGFVESTNRNLDHGDVEQGLAGLRETFVVLAQATKLSQPGERAFDDPALRQYFNAPRCAAGDLQRPAAAEANPFDHAAGVSSVGANDSQSRGGQNRESVF